MIFATLVEAYELIRERGAKGLMTPPGMVRVRTLKPEIVAFMMTGPFKDIAEEDNGYLFSIHDYEIIEKNMLTPSDIRGSMDVGGTNETDSCDDREVPADTE